MAAPCHKTEESQDRTGLVMETPSSVSLLPGSPQASLQCVITNDEEDTSLDPKHPSSHLTENIVTCTSDKSPVFSKLNLQKTNSSLVSSTLLSNVSPSLTRELSSCSPINRKFTQDDSCSSLWDSSQEVFTKTKEKLVSSVSRTSPRPSEDTTSPPPIESLRDGPVDHQSTLRTQLALDTNLLYVSAPKSPTLQFTQEILASNCEKSPVFSKQVKKCFKPRFQESDPTRIGLEDDTFIGNIEKDDLHAVDMSLTQCQSTVKDMSSNYRVSSNLNDKKKRRLSLLSSTLLSDREHSPSLEFSSITSIDTKYNDDHSCSTLENSSKKLYEESSRGSYEDSSWKSFEDSSQRLFKFSSQRSYEDSSKVSYIDSTSELYGDSTKVSYGDVSKYSYKDSSIGSYGDRSKELYGDDSEEFYGDSSKELSGDSSNELYGDNLKESNRDSSMGSYEDRSNERGGDGSKGLDTIMFEKPLPSVSSTSPISRDTLHTMKLPTKTCSVNVKRFKVADLDKFVYSESDRKCLKQSIQCRGSIISDIEEDLTFNNIDSNDFNRRDLSDEDNSDTQEELPSLKNNINKIISGSLSPNQNPTETSADNFWFLKSNHSSQLFRSPPREQSQYSVGDLDSESSVSDDSDSGELIEDDRG